MLFGVSRLLSRVWCCWNGLEGGIHWASASEKERLPGARRGIRPRKPLRAIDRREGYKSCNVITWFMPQSSPGEHTRTRGLYEGQCESGCGVEWLLIAAVRDQKN